MDEQMKIWNGTERRKVQDHSNPYIICKQEDKITGICEGMVRVEGRLEKLDMRINGTLEKFGVHVEDSDWWRRFIMTTAVSLVIAIFGGMTSLGVLVWRLGEYTEQIHHNTESIKSIEAQHDKYGRSTQPLP